MAHSRVQLGVLAPLKDIDVVDSTTQAITLFEGFNTIGRSDLLAASKQVSRKHVSIHASNGLFQVTVEGQNPIVLRTGTERVELRPQEKAFVHAGDIVEFLPGKYAFKLMADIHEKSDSEMVKEEKKLLVKRKRQEMEDESMARALQAIEDKTAQTSYSENVSEAKVDCLTTAERKIQNNSMSCLKNNSRFQGVTEGYNPRTFQLLRVRGLPDWANAGCIGIQDVIEGDVLFAMLSNYMVDLEWLLSACPLLNRVSRVVVVHGESGSSLECLKAGKPSQWLLHKPPLPLSYGTHHSKAMILIYQTGVRVIVHTANLIYVDWNNKTQGLWMQDFPYKKDEDKGARSPFEDDLIEYLEALQWNGCTANLPNHGNTKINASFFRKFDYSSAKVRLIASVPGYHQGHKLRKWGHMKLRTVLEQHHFEEDFVKSPLVYQFSSLGSLDEKWIEEFSTSTSAGYTFQSKGLGLGSFQILWPTVEDVRCSIEGYGAGNAIPSPLKNVEKEFLKKYWARWQADHTGRSQAMPHFKSYIRYNGQDLAWILLTSANLSKAAWGALQKNGSQLMIRSYELGVLFLPFEQNPGSSFSCTGGKIRNQEHYTEKKSTEAVKFATTCYKSDNDKEQSSNILRFPIPYRLPLKRYDSEDIPWSWDRQYFKPDTYGELWPRVVKLYGTKDN